MLTITGADSKLAAAAAAAAAALSRSLPWRDDSMSRQYVVHNDDVRVTLANRRSKRNGRDHSQKGYCCASLVRHAAQKNVSIGTHTSVVSP